MGYFDYSREPRSDIAFVDMKSFYASVECVDRGLHPLKTSLCVMSRAENASGLILASSPTFKKVLERQMSAELMICRLMFTRASFLITMPNVKVCLRRLNTSLTSKIGQRRLGLYRREWTATLRKSRNSAYLSKLW